MSEQTENEIIRNAVIDGMASEPLEIGGIYAFKFSDKVQTVDLTGDEYRANPRHKVGCPNVQDIASFCHYWDKHHDADSDIYADIDGGLIEAVLDAHHGAGKDGRFGQHRIRFQLQHTRAWKVWTGSDGILMPQAAFAEFLEDNLADIASEPVPAATMLEVATSFHARQRVAFSSGTVLSSGDLSLNYEEDTTASAGRKGHIDVPREFAVGVAVFDDTDRYGIKARLRYRIDNGHLKLGYILDRPEDYARDAVKEVVVKLETAVGIKVIRGQAF